MNRTGDGVRILGCVVVLFLLVMLTLQPSSGAPATPKRGGNLTIGMGASPQTLNSIIDPGIGIRILNQSEDGLLNRDATYQKVIPALALEVPRRTDAVTYVFKVRPNVKFQNGRTVTADDVVFSYNRLIDPVWRASFGLMYRQNIANVRAIDPQTVEFKLRNDWPIFMSLVAGNHTKIVAKEDVEAPAYGVTTFGGTGPFKITSWVKGQSVALERSTSYWKPDLPFLDKVTYRVVPDEGAQVAALRTGQLDVLIAPTLEQFLLFAKDPNFTVVGQPSANTTILTFNTTKPPFNNKDVRQAISLAIDREELVKTVFRGYAHAAGDVFPNWHWAHNANIVVRYDPQRAKELLSRAGFTDANPLTFTLLPINESLYMDQATIIQAQLAKIGVKVELRPTEYTAQTALVANIDGAWQAALYRVTPLRGTAYEYAFFQYGATGPLNRSGINRTNGARNAELEDLLQRAIAYSDYDNADRLKARPVYAAFSRLLNEESPQIRLNFFDDLAIVRKHVMNYVVGVFGVNVIEQVWLNK
jgi:peptide/nickel transport system substrate-binding protein